MCDELTKRRKRSFREAWLTNDRYKLWIRKVPSDDSLYFCSVCNKQFSCNSKNLEKHADSAYHINNIKKNSSLCSNNDNEKSIQTSKSIVQEE